MSHILFYAHLTPSFVRQDIEILKEKNEVSVFIFSFKKGFQVITSLIKQFFWTSKNIRKADIVFVWFSDYHSFIPLLLAWAFHKKSILVIGGYDATWIPELSYGGHSNPFRKWIITSNLRLATKILPVSHFLEQELSKHSNHNFIKKSEVVYNGADIEYFFRTKPKKKQIVCVSTADTKGRFLIKGLDKFISTAAQLPEIHFILVGTNKEITSDIMSSPIPQNIEFIEWADREELRDILSESLIICQFSKFESFGLAVAEGMLCECIPVVPDQLGVSELVGRHELNHLKFYPNTVENAVAAIVRALSLPEGMGSKAREQIINNFSLHKRRNKLYDLTEVGN